MLLNIEILVDKKIQLSQSKGYYDTFDYCTVER